MSLPLTVAFAAFLTVVAFVLLVASLVQRRPASVRRRLDDHSVGVSDAVVKRQERIAVLKRQAYGSASGAKRLFRPATTASQELAQSGLEIPVSRYLMLRTLCAVLVFLLVLALAGNVLFAIPASVIGAMAPRTWLRRQGRKRIKAFEAQLAESIDLLVGALRAGHGFLQGLESVTSQMEDPTRAEYTKVIEEVNIGINPVDALHALAERIPSYDLALLVSAISVQRQTGGNLAEVLENLASTVRERRRIRGEVQALTTGPRASSYVLAAIPFLLFLYFNAISSDYRDVMLGSTYGHLLLGVAAVLSTIGFVFSRKVAKVEY
jgi:tight adherence protein B